MAISEHPKRKHRRRRIPARAAIAKNAAIAGAGGAVATFAIDRTMKAVENGIAKAVDKKMNRNSWEQAAQNVN